MISHLQQTTVATPLLWIGWFLMLIGLFMPVINIPIPDPHMAPLLFFGLPVPKVDDNGEIAVLTHAPIVGLKIVFFLFIKTLEKARFSLDWGLLLILSVPVLLALVSPVLLWVKSKISNIFLACCFGVGFLGPGMMLLLSADESVIGSGFYYWVMALLLLMMSRVMACFSKTHD